MIGRVEPGQEMPLRPAEGGGHVDPAPLLGDARGTDGVDFGAVLAQSVADAARLQATASQKVEALAKGASDDLHGTMISVKEAEISMKLVGTVRNRLLDAFHELWRINL